ncbi:hypothetical protein [Orgyia pseudotsugata single capsid nuclopolyhedrovirus]|nr:hypothetical protein [Orgyia pseudotsugata single capsid nuclopolyhedrovirus]
MVFTFRLSIRTKFYCPLLAYTRDTIKCPNMFRITALNRSNVLLFEYFTQLRAHWRIACAHTQTQLCETFVLQTLFILITQ